jgi:hypothetical protein
MGGAEETRLNRPIALRPAMTRMPRWHFGRWIPLLAVWIAGAAYVGARLDTNWVPLDEGTLAQSAERVLHGELPHRDFDDVYTGGLARFDAVVFETIGTRLSSLRTALFAVFLLWVPAVYYIARRFAKPLTAAAVTLLCIIWTLPTNPSAMPSWYNLFLATFGIATLIRFTETRQRAWLFAAGVAGGLSMVVKIVGLYYIAGALFFFALDEQQTSKPEAGKAAPSWRFAYPGLLTALGLVFVVLLVYFVRGIPRESRLIQFVLPGAMVAGVLAAGEWRDPGREALPVRVRNLATLIGPFALGVALPIGLFILPYLASGSLVALLRGVFVVPMRRYGFAVVPPASLGTLGAALPWLLLLTPRRLTPSGKPGSHRLAVVALSGLAIALGALAFRAAHGGVPYVAVWLTIYYLAPCTVAAGCMVVWRWRRQPDHRSSILREQVWLLTCMTATCSLVQVPMASWGYILFFAPIAILAVLAIVTSRPPGPGVRSGLVAGFFLVFGVTAVNPNHIALWKGTYLPSDSWRRVPLSIDRAGLDVSAADANLYQSVVGLLRTHSRPGGYIYATPDCPELYFLADRRNPTRTLFEFFDDTAGRDARIAQELADHDVTAVAINTAPEFSPPVDADLGASLRSRYPDSAVAGDFVVRWRQGN